MKGGGSIDAVAAWSGWGGTRLGTKAGARGVSGSGGVGSGSGSGWSSVGVWASASSVGRLIDRWIGRLERIVGEGATDRAVGIDMLFQQAGNVEIADIGEGFFDIAEVGLADHLVDVGLEFRGHPAGFFDHAGYRADGGGHVLWPDRDQCDGSYQEDFRPGEIEHGCACAPGGAC